MENMVYGYIRFRLMMFNATFNNI